jgi:hypothetical protein
MGDHYLLEGYGNDNPGAKSQGLKQLMSGAGIAVVGMVLVPLLSWLFCKKLTIKFVIIPAVRRGDCHAFA